MCRVSVHTVMPLIEINSWAFRSVWCAFYHSCNLRPQLSDLAMADAASSFVVSLIENRAKEVHCAASSSVIDRCITSCEMPCSESSGQGGFSGSRSCYDYGKCQSVIPWWLLLQKSRVFIEIPNTRKKHVHELLEFCFLWILVTLSSLIEARWCSFEEGWFGVRLEFGINV